MWSHYKLSRNLEIYVLSSIRVGVVLGVGGRVSGKISVLTLTLNYCFDCGCSPHNKPRYVMLLGGCGMFDNVCSLDAK